MTSSFTMPPQSLGVDLLVPRGPSIDALAGALCERLGLDPAAIVMPDDDDTRLLDALDHDAWVRIHTYGGGEFAYKVDLDGKAPRDYETVARDLAAALGCTLYRPDESTLSPIAWIGVHADGHEAAVTIDDAEPDGFVLR